MSSILESHLNSFNALFIRFCSGMGDFTNKMHVGVREFNSSVFLPIVTVAKTNTLLPKYSVSETWQGNLIAFKHIPSPLNIS